MLDSQRTDEIYSMKIYSWGQICLECKMSDTCWQVLLFCFIHLIYDLEQCALFWKNVNEIEHLSSPLNLPPFCLVVHLTDRNTDRPQNHLVWMALFLQSASCFVQPDVNMDARCRRLLTQRISDAPYSVSHLTLFEQDWQDGPKALYWLCLTSEKREGTRVRKFLFFLWMLSPKPCTER